ncbi:MAG: 50S ribosomal protein L4 [Eubacteriales bacterium]|nr:50S ribosomal protein L4 [Eubacteriales bacterium]
MAKVDLYNMNGDIIGDIDLNDEVFNAEIKENSVHQAVVCQLANMRQGTHSAKTKGEVSGGGKKPWRQKGTGRARQGSIRSAQWIKGGIIFGPKPRDYSTSINKKERRAALRSVLTSKVAEKEIRVLDKFEFEEIKTKRMSQVLDNLKTGETTLLVLAGKDLNVERSARNIKGVKIAFINTINVYDILRHKSFLITKEAAEKVGEVYAL